MKRFAKIVEADKSRFIDKNENLTNIQKEEVKLFFKKHPDQENKIDWNKSNSLQYSDFFNVISKFNERFLPKLTLDDLVEGTDYIYLGKDNRDSDFYLILNHKASVTIASNNVGEEVWSPLCGWYKDNSFTGEETNWRENVLYDYPQELEKDGTILYGGAKWCTAMNHTTKFWEQYTSCNVCLVYCLTSDIEEYAKLAFTINKNETELVKITRIYNAFDGYCNIEHFKEECNFLTENNILRKYLNIPPIKSPLVTRNIIYKNDFSAEMQITKMGEREEGTVWGITSILPSCPAYSSDRAFYACKKGLSKGDYYTTDQEFSFTLTKDIPVGGRLYGDFGHCKLYAFDKDGRSIIEETKIFPHKKNGTHLGDISYKLPSSDTTLSALEFTNGCSLWEISLIRQWLNSAEKEKGAWWKPQDAWDCLVPGSEAYMFVEKTSGFISGISGLDMSKVKVVKNETYEYTRKGEYKYVETTDKFWIPSVIECNIDNADADVNEGTPLSFWKHEDWHRFIEIDNFGFWTRTTDTIYRTYCIDFEGNTSSVCCKGKAFEPINAMILFVMDN